MADLTKTIQTELRAITEVAANANDVSSVLSVADYFAAMIFIDHGRRSTTAPTQGTEYRIEASQQASGDDTWRPLVSIVTGKVAAVTYTVNASHTAGTNTFTTTATPTNFVTDDLLFFDNATTGNSEWARMLSKSGSVITVQDNILNDQDNAVVYDQAEHFAVPVDLTAIKRIRVVCNNNYLAGNGPAITWRCAIITADAIA